MRPTIRISLVLLVATCRLAAAGERSTTIKWSDISGERLENRTVVADSVYGDVLLIENTEEKPLAVRIATVSDSLPSSHLFAVRGYVRYEDVESGQTPGFFESWQYFAGGGQYFSRTLGTHGVMQSLTGTSDWREFALVFHGSEESGPPKRIEVNLNLPSTGKVWIGSLDVVGYSADEWGSAFSPQGAWWSDRQAGLVGGIAGAIIGVIGAVIGGLCGVGRGRNIAVGLGWLVLVSGVTALIAGAAAVIMGQPYAVYYPLLLIGAIATGVMGLNMRTIGKRFAEAEMRRMQAMDA